MQQESKKVETRIKQMQISPWFLKEETHLAKPEGLSLAPLSPRTKMEVLKYFQMNPVPSSHSLVFYSAAVSDQARRGKRHWRLLFCPGVRFNAMQRHVYGGLSCALNVGLNR